MSDFNNAQQKQINDFKNWSPSADPDWVQAVLDTVISISDADMDTITTDLDNNPDFGPEDTPYFVDKPMEDEDRRAGCFTPEQQTNLATGQYSQVVGRHITTPEDVSVVDKVPGHKDGDEMGMESLITLTTCHPQFSAAERMIIHGMEVERIDKSTGKKPAALEAEVA